MAALDVSAGLAPVSSRKLASGSIAALTPQSSSLLRRYWAKVVARIAEWKDRARSRGELSAFDERDLADIGQTRASAFLEVRKPFWKA